MTMTIETIDGGEIEAGFRGSDFTRVRLGELPPMTIQHFVGHAALALVRDIVPRLDADMRAEWARDAHSLREQVEGAPLRGVSGKFFAQGTNELISQIDTIAPEDREELGAELAASLFSPDEQAEYYRESPFKVQADGQRVGFIYEEEVRHVVGSPDFFKLAYYVIRGGFRGWGKYGTYQEVKDAAVQIDAALSGA